jgi:hypothetical protein
MNSLKKREPLFLITERQEVKTCIIFLLRAQTDEDSRLFRAFSDALFHIEPDIFLISALRRISNPTKIRYICFSDKFQVLISLENGGKIMSLPLSDLANINAIAIANPKNKKNLEILEGLAAPGKKINAVIFLPN